MPYTVKIGPDVNNVADVLIEPVIEFFEAAEVEENVCNKSQYTGSARCRWTYPDRLLEGEQFYQLKSLVGNEASANVVMDIPGQEVSIETYEPVISTYNAVMHWPEEGVVMVSNYRWKLPDDGILFTNLEAI